jgi:hypothetical protein
MLRRGDARTQGEPFFKTRGRRQTVIVSAPVRRLALGVCFVWLAGSCGTDAVGVSECREVEQARCGAAVSCGYADVEECRRFYRDHCLHGVALDKVDTVQVDQCVAQIQSAGQCAAEQPGAAPADCAQPIATQTSVKVCDVVLRPELATACAFLVPAPEPAAAPAAADAGGR